MNGLKAEFDAARDLEWVNYGSCIRLVPPEQTLSWLQSKLKPCGITRIADVTGLDRIGIPVVVAVRPMSRSLSVSQGKGKTLAAASVSAVMESIELMHAEMLRTPEQDHPDISPDSPIFSESDLIPGQSQVSSGVTSQTSEPTVAAYEVLSGRVVGIPYRTVSMNTVGLIRPGAVTTNGLASGNSRAEAACHSVFEIIERHAFSEWFSLEPGERAKTAVLPESIDSSNQILIDKVRKAELTINIFDLTDYAFGLPCYLAEISNPREVLMPTRPYTGRGLHVNSEIALARAITESAQSRLTMISGARDDNFAEDYFIWSQAQTAEPRRTARTTSAAMYREWQSNPISFLETILREAGYKNWIVFDYTDEAYGVPVVKSFVPGMLHEVV